MDNQGTKRERITKAQRITLLEVLIASLILGVCLVVANFLMKYIKFNTKIITAKNDAISEYDQTIRATGICEDMDKNGRLNDTEIEACRPNETSLEKVTGSLRYNIYEVMAQNTDLEAVARKRDEDGICYNDDGTVRDYTQEHERATTDAERERALQGMRLCSSLRVISDALPDHKNTEALMASLNQLFIVSKVEPETIAPRDDLVTTEVVGVGVIPVTFRMEGTGAEVIRVLDNVERSIREFDITSASVEWTTKGLGLRANANAYYLDEIFDPETMMTVRAKGDTGGIKSGASLSERSAAAQELLK